MTRFLTILAAALMFSMQLSAQTTAVIRDSNASVDKWPQDTKAGLYVLDGQKTIGSNIPVTVKDAEAGLFNAKVKGLKNGKDYRMFVYAPFIEGNSIMDDGKMKVTVPSIQDESNLPLNFGTAEFKGARKPEISCDFAARTTNVIIKLSSKCIAYNGWNVDKITLVTEEGIIAGDALMDVKSGKIAPDPEGEHFNNVSYVPSEKFVLGPEYRIIKLKLIPCKDLHGTKFRVDYSLSKDGKSIVVCHDVVGMTLYESYTYTLEERVPAVIAGRWHTSEFPGENWEEVAPEEKGYSTAKLEELRKYIQENCTTTSMMVIVDGKVIFKMGDLEEPVRIASCRKSLMSMLYGKYVENGTINLDATLEELGIDDKGGLLPIERKTTVRNLITARSGVYHPASNDGDDTKYAPVRGSVEPGTYYLYNNWDFNAAGGVFEKLTGKDIYDAFQEDIAIPVGMQDYKIDNQHKTGITDPTLSNFLAYHFWLSTRDMARVAYLMLHKGMWNGTQVISEDWVKTTTSIVTPRKDMNPKGRLTKEFDYGYLWWLFCKEYTGYDPAVYEDGFTATGSGGQYMTVLPKLNMVIAHKDKNEKTQKSDYYKLIARVAACKE